jgi:hypothetical protein
MKHHVLLSVTVVAAVCCGAIAMAAWSFDATINQNGVTAKFHVTCANGCVSTVTVI